MLVLQRLESERIIINDNITVTVVSSKGKSVKLGIDAPEDVPIVREELAKTKKKDRS